MLNKAISTNILTRDFILFSLAVAGMGMASGIHETSYNNYLSDIFAIGAEARGFLEFPRELPGLLAVFIAGALLGFGPVKVGVIAIGMLTIGLFGLGFLSTNFSWMVVYMVIWSMGNHLFMPLEGSIAVGLAKDRGVGEVLGKIGSIRLATTILGAAVIWIGFGSFLETNLSYQQSYFIAMSVGLGAMVALIAMRSVRAEGKPTRLVWRSEYKIYYWLCLLWGIRKQIFITFAPWLIIQHFQQSASIIAQLWIATSIIGIVFRPLLGRLSDRYGERVILVGEVPIIILTFLGYAWAPFIANAQHGLYLIFICYIVNSVLGASSMIRTSYISKILTHENDLTPTLAMGVSLDHATAMLMPMIGGLIWGMFGSQYVFLTAIVFLLISGYVASKAVVPSHSQPTTVSI